MYLISIKSASLITSARSRITPRHAVFAERQTVYARSSTASRPAIKQTHLAAKNHRAAERKCRPGSDRAGGEPVVKQRPSFNCTVPRTAEGHTGPYLRSIAPERILRGFADSIVEEAALSGGTLGFLEDGSEQKRMVTW